MEPTEVAVSEEAMVYAPSDFVLAQNVPNPFNAFTTIPFEVPSSAKGFPVELTIYDMAGQKVQTLLRGEVSAGQTTVTWNGRDSFGRPVASGIYFYRLEARDLTDTRRMVLLR